MFAHFCTARFFPYIGFQLLDRSKIIFFRIGHCLILLNCILWNVGESSSFLQSYDQCLLRCFVFRWYFHRFFAGIAGNFRSLRGVSEFSKAKKNFKLILINFIKFSRKKGIASRDLGPFLSQVRGAHPPHDQARLEHRRRRRCWRRRLAAAWGGRGQGKKRTQIRAREP